MDNPIRLQKYLAERGICSRRQGEEMIRAGRVSVNGKTAQIGCSVSETDKVCIDGKPLRADLRKPTYLILYKPRGVVTTLSDERGRRCLKDFLGGVSARVFPVGRLDKDSEGMVLLTDDGELANRLTAPKNHIPKTYRVTVDGLFSDEIIREMTAGMTLDEGENLLPVKIELRERDENRSVVHITLYEGKNRQIRRMCEQVGLNVRLLKRESIGDLRLGDIHPGKIRFLSEEEIRYIKSL